MGDSRVAQQLFQSVFHLFHPGEAVEHDMGREGVFGCADGPDMNVVNRPDSRNGCHLRFDLRNVDTSGTPSSERRRLSRVSDQTEATITAATTSPTMGSTTVQPVHEITRPETSTPTDTSASAAMCR